MTNQFYRTEINYVTKFLPEKRITNDYLSTIMDTNDAWIKERSGIHERRFVDEPTSTSDLGIEAVRLILKKSGYAPKDFDFIIGCTLSPDYYFPGIAPMIQNKLNFPFLPSLDIRVQCSAFVYSIQLADSLIQSGKYKRILIVYSDVQSKLLDLTTEGRNVAVLFGDGAGALICEAKSCDANEKPSGKNKATGVIDSILGADGSGTELLLVRSPGTATNGFLNKETFDNGDWHPKMDGRTVFKHAVSRMCETVETLLKKNQLTVNDIDLLIPHQANMRISDYVREKLEFPQDKVYNNIQKYGNTTSATIAICLEEALSEKKLKKGDLLLTVAFGAGFTWGGNLIRI